MFPQHPRSTLFPYTTLFRSHAGTLRVEEMMADQQFVPRAAERRQIDVGDAHPAGVVEVPQSKDRVTPERSEEHTSELQSRFDLVCRLLLEKKKDAPYE